jgi:hypothetical protein
MNARKEIRYHLIAECMHYWLKVALAPGTNPKCPTWRARRNFWHLCRKYPDLSRCLGLDELSVLQPIAVTITAAINNDQTVSR